MRVVKAIVPAAGLGTRMRPASLAISKSLFPLVVDTVIDIIINEICSAGIEEIYLIVKNSEDPLKIYLEKSGNYAEKVKLKFVYQKEPKGLGHAVSLAANFIQPEEYFLLVLPDNLMLGTSNVSKMLLEVYDTDHQPICGIEKVSEQEIHLRASLDLSPTVNAERFFIEAIVDKPQVGAAPSLYTIAGRYILPYHIFSFIDELRPDKNGEIQFTQALADFVKNNTTIAALTKTERFDTGSELGYTKAFIRHALNKFGGQAAFVSWLNQQIEQ